MRKVVALLLLACACVTLSPSTVFTARSPAATVRVMTWNIGANSIFPDGDPGRSADERPEGFARIIRTLRPDVICIEEVSRGFQAVAGLLDDVAPLDDGARWQAHGAFDVVVASRWPLRMTDARVLDEPPRKRAHTMALVDVPGERDLYVVCAHNQSRSGAENVAFRQKQSDMIASWLRDARTAGGSIDIPARTPIVIAGDFNVVPSDAGNHIRTLLTGDVLDDATYGPDAPPDWDGSSLTDLRPRQNRNRPERWTWRYDAEGYAPSALDRMIYTDSVLHAENAFILNTEAMTRAELAASGLKKEDVMRDAAQAYYDHLPIVADFRFR